MLTHQFKEHLNFPKLLEKFHSNSKMEGIGNTKVQPGAFFASFEAVRVATNPKLLIKNLFKIYDHPSILEPLLKYPDYERSFITDTSDYGFGAVIAQEDLHSPEIHPVSSSTGRAFSKDHKDRPLLRWNV